jgi:hypothetical protein
VRSDDSVCVISQVQACTISILLELRAFLAAGGESGSASSGTPTPTPSADESGVRADAALQVRACNAWLRALAAIDSGGPSARAPSEVEALFGVAMGVNAQLRRVPRAALAHFAALDGEWDAVPPIVVDAIDESALLAAAASTSTDGGSDDAIALLDGDEFAADGDDDVLIDAPFVTVPLDVIAARTRRLVGSRLRVCVSALMALRPAASLRAIVAANAPAVPTTSAAADTRARLAATASDVVQTLELTMCAERAQRLCTSLAWPATPASSKSPPARDEVQFDSSGLLWQWLSEVAGVRGAAAVALHTLLFVHHSPVERAALLVAVRAAMASSSDAALAVALAASAFFDVDVADTPPPHAAADDDAAVLARLGGASPASPPPPPTSHAANERAVRDMYTCVAYVELSLALRLPSTVMLALERWRRRAPPNADSGKRARVCDASAQRAPCITQLCARRTDSRRCL